jgi:hypothetical protein
MENPGTRRSSHRRAKLDAEHASDGSLSHNAGRQGTVLDCGYGGSPSGNGRDGDIIRGGGGKLAMCKVTPSLTIVSTVLEVHVEQLPGAAVGALVIFVTHTSLAPTGIEVPRGQDAIPVALELIWIGLDSSITDEPGF